MVYRVGTRPVSLSTRLISFLTNPARSIFSRCQALVAACDTNKQLTVSLCIQAKPFWKKENKASFVVLRGFYLTKSMNRLKRRLRYIICLHTPRTYLLTAITIVRHLKYPKNIGPEEWFWQLSEVMAFESGPFLYVLFAWSRKWR